MGDGLKRACKAAQMSTKPLISRARLIEVNQRDRCTRCRHVRLEHDYISGCLHELRSGYICNCMCVRG